MTFLCAAAIAVILAFTTFGRAVTDTGRAPAGGLAANDTVLFYGNSMVERLLEHGEFEAMLQLSDPAKKLHVRSLAWTGDEVGTRLRPEGYAEHMKNLIELWPAQVIVLGYGMNEAFAGQAGLADFRTNLNSHIDQLHRVHKGARFVLLSPTAVEAGVPHGHPDAAARNRDVALYAKVIQEVAAARGAQYIDLFTTTQKYFERGADAKPAPDTTDGLHLSDTGNRLIARLIAAALVGDAAVAKLDPVRIAEVAKAAAAKHDYNAYATRPINAVVYYGVRKRPEEYKTEMPRYYKMIELLEDQVHQLAADPKLKFADLPRPTLPKIADGRSNKDRHGIGTMKSPAEAMKEFKIADGYAVNLFASEEQFPDLRNCVQMAFDARGRLWVVTMPSWPHTVPGEPKLDKIIILEDTDHDGKADKCTTFASGFDALDGVAFHERGVIISAQPRLWLMRDTDGDGKADEKEELLRGIDVTDCHHGGMVDVDPIGNVLFSDGVFHRSQIETPFGVHRGFDATTYRLDPRTGAVHTEYQTLTPNPWKITFNRTGQMFQMYGGGNLNDAVPLAWTPLGIYHGYASNTILDYGKGCGACVIDGPNFPANLRGGWASATLLGNYFVALTTPRDNGGSLSPASRLDVISSPNAAFRPADIAFGFDGAMYVSDFCNIIIGHAQNAMRDPRWDHDHGRIWRIVYKAGPIVAAKDWPKIEGASVDELLKLLNHPQMIVRQHARIALRAVGVKVVPAVDAFAQSQASAGDAAEQPLLESLWVLQGLGEARPQLIEKLLQSKDTDMRTAAVQLLRFSAASNPASAQLLAKAAADTAPRVQMAVINVVSHLRGDGVVTVEPIARSIKPASDHVTKMLKDLDYGTASRRGPSVPILEMAASTRVDHWLFTAKPGDKPIAFTVGGKKDAANVGNGTYRTYVDADVAKMAILGIRNGHLDVSVNGDQVLSQDSNWSNDQQPQIELRKGVNLIEVTFRALKGAPPPVYLCDPLGQPLAGVKNAGDEAKLHAMAAAWESAYGLGDAIRIQAVKNQMQFTPREIHIKAGQKVRIVFDNPDLMAHNIVIVDRGALEEVGELVDKMMTDPKAMEKSYIPGTPKILASIPLVNSAGRATLEFTAPREKGEYPFICTFPGHWRLMKGVIIVE